MNCSVSMS